MKAKAQCGQTSIIVIFLGILSFLGLLLVTVNTFSRAGGETAGGYVDQFRAKLLAQAGVERVITELQNYQVDQWLDSAKASWVYQGEDLNSNGLLDHGEDQNGNGQLDTSACPLELALHPSFAVLDATGQPVLKKIANDTIGYSGQISVAPGSADGIYLTKVIDVQSQIYLNGSDRGTRQLLNNLGTILDIDPTLGERIFSLRAGRPGGKFQVKEELRELLEPAVYERIKYYITCHSYLNPNVIRPKLLRERPHQPLQIGMNIISQAQLNPGPIQLEPRAPININTASREILMAVLANLSGFYLQQSGLPGDSKTAPFRLGVLQIVHIFWETDRDMIEKIADRIIQTRARTPFLEWSRFNKFCDQLVSAGILGPVITPEQRELAQARADLIKANANPNTIFNDFNPNQLVARLVDKSDLTIATTEFCFLPFGFFEIESVGLIVSVPGTMPRPALDQTASGNSNYIPNMRLSTRYKVRAVVDLFDQYQETSQRDFAGGTISNIPVNLPRGLTPGNKTLQAYPEPDIKKYTEQNISAGQIYLATLQNLSKNGQSNVRLTFQNHFNQSLNADVASGAVGVVKEAPSAGGTALRPHGQSIFSVGPAGPGSLYPDGAYSELNNCPAYQADGNLIDGRRHEKIFGEPRFRGTVTFWYKPNFNLNSTKPRTVFSVGPAKKTGDETAAPSNRANAFAVQVYPANYSDQNLFPRRLGQRPAGRLLWFWNMKKDLPDRFTEYIFSQTFKESNQYWIHIGLAWDTKPSTFSPTVICFYCQGRGKVKQGDNIHVLCPRCDGTAQIKKTKIQPEDVHIFCVNGQSVGRSYIGQSLPKFPPEIIEAVNLTSNNLIKLGTRITDSTRHLSGDFTIDELTIQIHPDLATAKEFIIEEYKAGRYYQGEGVFTSRLLSLPDQRTSSTVLPNGSRKEPIPAAENVSKIKAMAAWTVYYPAFGRSVRVQFFDQAGRAISPMLDNPAGSEFEIPLDPDSQRTNIRYKVFFQEVGREFEAPLLESPVFDDLTITFYKPDAKIIEWYMIPYEIP